MNAQPATFTAVEPQSADLREVLLQELSERETLIAELADRAAPHIDPVAWSTSATAKTVAEQIRNALARFDAGTYGLCTLCKGAIPPARLEAVPHAAYCMACQGNMDRF
ncbi:TraR/DksA family transcriptional regulator [Mycetocola zhadangensis]|uniref:TraR/DksA family transcriptional regulator n=1 Tax=Mycetocola zhadangensis TaxID=1164595 RepID=UPI003A4E49F0